MVSARTNNSHIYQSEYSKEREKNLRSNPVTKRKTFNTMYVQHTQSFADKVVGSKHVPPFLKNSKLYNKSTMSVNCSNEIFMNDFYVNQGGVVLNSHDSCLPIGDSHHMVGKGQDHVVGDPRGQNDLPGSQNKTMVNQSLKGLHGTVALDSHRRQFSESVDIPLRNIRNNYMRKGSKDSGTGLIDVLTPSLAGPTPGPLPK